MIKNRKLKKIFISLILLNIIAFAKITDDVKSRDIHIENLDMVFSAKDQIFSESLLVGEIADTEIDHISLLGPFSHAESILKDVSTILIFLKGNGTLEANDHIYNIKPESIAQPKSIETITIKVAAGDTLHYIKIQKKLSPQDLEDIATFPEENRTGIYFKHFDDCEAYTEKIKSPNTVSRTVLPKDHIPRVAMGTVQTIGPDAVGAHDHPMLDQLFLGLAGNDVIVHADDKQIQFKEYSILHIPIGSTHWATVDEGKNMYYQWMDFFLTKKGEVWLKTHKAINGYKKN